MKRRSRRSSPPFSFSPSPWHWKQFRFRIGRTSFSNESPPSVVVAWEGATTARSQKPKIGRAGDIGGNQKTVRPSARGAVLRSNHSAIRILGFHPLRWRLEPPLGSSLARRACAHLRCVLVARLHLAMLLGPVALAMEGVSAGRRGRSCASRTCAPRSPAIPNHSSSIRSHLSHSIAKKRLRSRSAAAVFKLSPGIRASPPPTHSGKTPDSHDSAAGSVPAPPFPSARTPASPR